MEWKGSPMTDLKPVPKYDLLKYVTSTDGIVKIRPHCLEISTNSVLTYEYHILTYDKERPEYLYCKLHPFTVPTRLNST